MNRYANCPGLKVVCPSNPYDAKGLLKAAIRDNDPVVFMESEQMYGDKGEVPEGEYIIPIGVADVVREGSHVTLVSFGKIMKKVKEAADLLAEEGIESDVIDLRTVHPIDYDTILSSVKKTNRLVIVKKLGLWHHYLLTLHLMFREMPLIIWMLRQNEFVLLMCQWHMHLI